MGKRSGTERHDEKMARMHEQLSKVFENQRRRILELGAPNANVSTEDLEVYWRKKRLGDELRPAADRRDGINIDIRR